LQSKSATKTCCWWLMAIRVVRIWPRRSSFDWIELTSKDRGSRGTSLWNVRVCRRNHSSPKQGTCPLPDPRMWLFDWNKIATQFPDTINWNLRYRWSSAGSRFEKLSSWLGDCTSASDRSQPEGTPRWVDLPVQLFVFRSPGLAPIQSTHPNSEMHHSANLIPVC
jgi:hypothetical protein